jgi:hypothetical protein
MVPAALADSFEPPTLSGRVYSYYLYDLTSMEDSSDEGAHEFEISRVYVNIKGALTEKLYYRITTDVGREKYTYYTYELVLDEVSGEYSLIPTQHTETGKYDVYLKYGYFELRDTIPYHKFYAGQVSTPWIGNEERIWGWRVIHKVAIDGRKFHTSADLGVGFKGGFGEGLFKDHLTFTNGAGYKAPEDGTSGKCVAYRASVFPLASNEDFKGLSVNAYVKADNLGEKVAAGEAKNPDMLYGGLLALEHEFVNFGAGYFMRSLGEDNASAGTSKVESNIMTAYATGHFRATEGMTVHPLVRYDAYEPDKETADDKRNLIIGGVGLKFFDGALALIPNYQTESYTEVDPLSGATEDKSNDYVYLHCEWNWK